MLSPQTSAPTRRTSVPTVRDRRADWLAVAAWAVAASLLSAAAWAGVWSLCRLLAGLPQ